jgi:hypothetical protein
MPKGPQGQKRPAPLAVAAVFGAPLFIGTAAVVDWSLKLKSPFWAISELVILAAILVWRRCYVRHVLDTQRS